ncbi:hypothetical protein [Roseomonas marmotae]|uniref:Uncharacterized protein n=1 Tax=Roseomonas marmotae TaxID=2768161 RepID=A0ABS3KE67_9PROT|nr:hypothetical protein [Roseomonas marmotae]MBO1075230.1 hypothetical protein [Roseomonas marmotae]QTI79664.1 hypothetical protein IAI58_02330 [Roseomonas marmotae]
MLRSMGSEAQPVEDADLERLALEAGVAEARAGGLGHEKVRTRLLDMIGAARQRLDAAPWPSAADRG